MRPFTYEKPATPADAVRAIVAAYEAQTSANAQRKERHE